jgi:LysR family transcriptional regulator, cyn operon transcriptional activator
MNFRHLRAFVAIADAGGFARASARLNLSQPAASRQILALEADLGVRLFDRTGQRIQLTSEGEDILRRSRRLLADAESLRERARAFRGGQAGILRIGATPQAIETVLANFFTLYRHQHPEVEVHLVEGGGAVLLSSLERGEIHVAITTVADERFHGRPLYPVYLLAVMSEGHQLSRRAVLEIAHLADEPMLLLRREFRSRTWFDAHCDASHIQPQLFLESGAPQTLIALAAAGCGIAVVPSSVQIPREGLRAVPLVQRGKPLGRWSIMAWDSQRPLLPYAHAFAAELANHVRHTYPGRDLTQRAPPLPTPRMPPKGPSRIAS